MNEAELVKRLVETVHSYYPAGLRVSDPGYRTSPEIERLLARREEAQATESARWSEFVRACQAALPGHRLWDTTYLRADNCYRLRVYLASTPLPLKVDHAVRAATVVLLSVLAPVHAIYTALEREVNGKAMESVVLHEPFDATQEQEAVIRRLLTKRIGSTALSWRALATPVPDVDCFNVILGKATLADCLFTDDRH